MTRLIVEYKGAKRIVARTAIGIHDGSINLSLVRTGSNSSGWEWNSSRGAFDPVEYSGEEPKTKRITIHMSGRVNYHGPIKTGTNFIPCLLDLVEAVPIVVYVIPSIQALDLVTDSRADDFVVNVINEWENSITMEFSAIPVNFPPLQNEVYRFIIEECYGLACVIVKGNPLIGDGLPAGAFTIGRPISPLTDQSVSEEMAFIRFQKLMHEKQVRSAIKTSEIPENEHDQIVNEIIRKGRGVIGPNGEGVWEIVLTQPMRIRPRLVVRFADSRYRAELVDMQSVDVRLERVRVRFKVFDEHENRWIKHSVAILDVFLDAEL